MLPPATTRHLCLTGLVAAAVALAACGGSSSSNSSSSTAGAKPAAPAGGGYGGGGASSGGTTSGARNPSQSAVTVAAVETGGLSFAPKALSAQPGDVTLKLSNPGSNGLPHAIALEGNGLDKSGTVVQPGGTSTVTARLKAGTYQFYCPVPGHRQAGMAGTLTVR